MMTLEKKLKHPGIKVMEHFYIRPTRFSRLRARVVIFANFASMKTWERLSGNSSRGSFDGSCSYQDRGPVFAEILLDASREQFLETVIHECVHAAFWYLLRCGVKSVESNYFLEYSTRSKPSSIPQERLSAATDWMAGAIIRKAMFRVNVKF